MIIYICNFISIFIWGKLIKNRKLLISIVSLQMFLILALRNLNMGSDLVNYKGGFEYIASLPFADLIKRLHLFKTAELVNPYSYESGYVVLNKIISLVGGNFRFFLIIVAAFCSFSFAYFIYKYSSIPYLSFAMLAAMGFYEYSFGILRQTLAVCILLWAVPFISKRKFIKFSLITIVAFAFHRAAVIFFLLYPLSKFVITKKTFKIYYIVWLLLLLFTPVIFEKAIVPLLKLFGKNRYSVGSYTFNKQIVVMILFAIMVHLFSNYREFKNNRDANIICMGYLLSVIFEIFGMMNDGLARIVEFYFIFIIVLVPNVLYSYRQKSRTLAISGERILYVLLFAYMIVTLLSSEIVPYTPLWEGVRI